jgi:hypothetical protein
VRGDRPLGELHPVSGRGLLVLWAAGVASCGTGAANDGGGHDRNGAIKSISDYVAAAKRTLCEVEVACARARDQASCQVAQHVGNDQDVLSVVAAVDRGTAIFDPVAGAGCLADYPRDCAIHISDPQSPACVKVLTGTVPVGSACVVGAECADEGRCVVAGGCTAACCVGTCAAAPTPVALNGDCSGPGAFCGAGSYCSVGKTCLTRKPLGAACDQLDACQEPSLCSAQGSSVPGTCAIPPGEGEPCGVGMIIACRYTYDFCDLIALVCTRRKNPGAPCGPMGDCVSYAICSNDLKCHANPVAGEACNDATGDSCIPGLLCDSGSCVPPPAATACVPPPR